METKTIRLYRPDEYERQAQDFYPTPDWVTQCLLDTVPLRGTILEPCAGQGAMAKVIADAGHQVVASDLVRRDGSAFLVLGGVDARQAALPPGVQTIATNPPYGLLPQLIPHWLAQLESVDGVLCLLLLAQWGKRSGQALTTQHPAYDGRVRLPRRVRWFPKKAGDSSPQHSHCWVVWDWARDQTQLPFDISAGDPRLMGRAIDDAGSPARGALVGGSPRSERKATLARLGIRGFKPTLQKAAERLETLRTPEGESVPPNTLAELRRDMARLGVVTGQIGEIERARLERLEQAPEEGSHAMVRLLAQVTGIGIETADMLVQEVLSRNLRDRRAVARYAGLTGAPDESGSRRREKELARAGNARVRRGMIQLAWRFLMFQKDSALAEWYRQRTENARGTRKTMIVALARKR